MAGNSQRPNRRKAGTKKGAVVGSGGQRRKQLKGKGPTPPAEQRTKHPAAKKAAAARKAAAASSRQSPRTTPGRRGPVAKDAPSCWSAGTRSPRRSGLRSRPPRSTSPPASPPMTG